METIMLYYFKREIHLCHINHIRTFIKLPSTDRFEWLQTAYLILVLLADLRTIPSGKTAGPSKAPTWTASLRPAQSLWQDSLSSHLLWFRGFGPVLLLLISLGKALLLSFKNITQMFWTMPPFGAKWQVVKQVNFVRPCVRNPSLRLESYFQGICHWFSLFTRRPPHIRLTLIYKMGAGECWFLITFLAVGSLLFQYLKLGLVYDPVYVGLYNV